MSYWFIILFLPPLFMNNQRRKTYQYQGNILITLNYYFFSILTNTSILHIPGAGGSRKRFYWHKLFAVKSNRLTSKTSKEAQVKNDDMPTSPFFSNSKTRRYINTSRVQAAWFFNKRKRKVDLQHFQKLCCCIFNYAFDLIPSDPIHWSHYNDF